MKAFFILFLFCFFIKQTKAQTHDNSNKQAQVIYRMSILKTGPALIPLNANEMKEALKTNNEVNVVSNLKKPGAPVSIMAQKNDMQKPVSVSAHKIPPNKK